jgi:hypothetical protein
MQAGVQLLAHKAQFWDQRLAPSGKEDASFDRRYCEERGDSHVPNMIRVHRQTSFCHGGVRRGEAEYAMDFERGWQYCGVLKPPSCHASKREGSGVVETICCHAWPFTSDTTFVGNNRSSSRIASVCLLMREIYVDMYGYVDMLTATKRTSQSLQAQRAV